MYYRDLALFLLSCDYEIAPHGYIIFRRDRNSCGGGVLIAVSDRFPSRLILANELIEMVVA